jgi:mycothiol synthase
MSELSLRPAADGDMEAIADVFNAALRADGVPQVITTDEIAEEFEDEHLTLDDDTRVAVVDGTIVGASYLLYVPAEEKAVRCYLDGHVRPEARGRGVGTALLDWSVARATERLAAEPAGQPTVIRATALDYLHDTHRLYQRAGLTPIRYHDELLRPLTDLPTLRQPDGVRIVPWPDGRDEEVRAVKNAAFDDHWGSTPTSADAWQHMIGGTSGRRDLSFVAMVDDRVVGHCVCRRYEQDDDLIGRRDGWIHSLGTLREVRGRGVASAMIAHALHAFADAGLTHASIEVDSENPTGAARLYRSLGFEPRQRTITFERWLCPEPS